MGGLLDLGLVVLLILVCTSPCLSKHPGTFLAAPLAACTPASASRGGGPRPPGSALREAAPSGDERQARPRIPGWIESWSLRNFITSCRWPPAKAGGLFCSCVEHITH
ncbi:Disco-interacting protein 2B [Manis javanica]|nr:Disco-interacting protein 2B [Manis javanica]